MGGNEELTFDFTCEHRPQLPHLRWMKEGLRFIDQYDVPSGHNSLEKNSGETLYAVALLMNKWVTAYRSNIRTPHAIHWARVLRKLSYVYGQLAAAPVIEHDIFPKCTSKQSSNLEHERVTVVQHMLWFGFCSFGEILACTSQMPKRLLAVMFFMKPDVRSFTMKSFLHRSMELWCNCQSL